MSHRPTGSLYHSFTTSVAHVPAVFQSHFLTTFPLSSFISSSLLYCPLFMLSHSLPVTLFQCFTNPLPHSCTQCTTLLRPPPPLFCPTVLSHCLAVPLLTTVQYSTVQSQYFTATNSQRHLSTVSLSLFHFPTLPLPLCFLAHHLTSPRPRCRPTVSQPPLPHCHNRAFFLSKITDQLKFCFYFGKTVGRSRKLCATSVFSGLL